MQHLPIIVIDGHGLDAPTAVIHDARADVYLVANAPARHGERTSSGFVSVLAPTGRVLRRKWIEGGRRRVELHAPGALTLRGDTLFVADQSCLRLFHRTSGRPLGSVCPDGAVELTALTVSDDVVYATTAVGIFMIDARGHVSRAPGSEAVRHASGIAAGPWGLFVTCAGADHVSQLTPAGPRPVLRGSARQLGGIVATRGGSFAFGNWTDSVVHYVDVRPAKGRGGLYTLARQLAEPGQLGYDARRDRILIPEASRRRVTVVELMKSEASWQPADRSR